MACYLLVYFLLINNQVNEGGTMGVLLKKIAITTALIVGAMSFSSQAELIHADWKLTNDNLATYDTNTGLAWLKFNSTKNQNVNSDFSSFEGWRLATESEVMDLWNSMFLGGYPSVNSGLYQLSSMINHEEILKFGEFLGGGYWGSTGYLYNSGHFVDDKNSSVYHRAGFIVTASGYGRFYNPDVFTGAGDTFSGVFLVSDATNITINGNLVERDVPVGGLVFGGLGLLSLMSLKRKSEI